MTYSIIIMKSVDGSAVELDGGEVRAAAAALAKMEGARDGAGPKCWLIPKGGPDNPTTDIYVCRYPGGRPIRIDVLPSPAMARRRRVTREQVKRALRLPDVPNPAGGPACKKWWIPAGPGNPDHDLEVTRCGTKQWVSPVPKGYGE